MAVRSFDVGIMLGVHQDPRVSVEKCQKVGVKNAQLGVPPDEWLTREKALEVAQMFREAGVTITTVFCGFEGERYDDIPTVQQTVGYIPDEFREVRVRKTLQIAEFARLMGVNRIAAHFGFIPEDPVDPRYCIAVETMQRICDYLLPKKMSFGLETGQETVETLLRFIKDVGRKNLNVNFDPANMILYGTEEPIAALRKVAPYVASVHCKDGLWPTEKGKLGTEVPLGEGQVGIDKFVATLKRIGYRGPLTIEREVPDPPQTDDMRKGKELLESLVKTKPARTKG
ncbi:MAG: sugar phosphate isomerase/epimerase [Armatimonadetes bacterium]|nr:sugar phosphate isomerase/epimerase [Armatimonadota bacterium]MDW8121404.1 sugar phosphate isomerase/epimerase family protein [Armatimonadota bacterium]